MEIDSKTLSQYLLFSDEIKYSNNITLYPVRMKNILSFQQCQIILTLRKNSIFLEKEIIKMQYLEFIKYSYNNSILEQKYHIPYLSIYYELTLQLLQLVCEKDAKITYNPQTLDFSINEEVITNEIFDDLRKIIIIQNDIDFDVDEFVNIDTLNALEKAREFEAKKNNYKSSIEDYIDSLVIALKVTEEYVSNITIRKFWRYIKRINKHEDYLACYSASMTGLVSFNESLHHWMTSIEVADKYANDLKINEEELRSKIEG